MPLTRESASELASCGCKIFVTIFFVVLHAVNVLADAVKSDATKSRRDGGKSQSMSFKDVAPPFVSVIAVVANPKAFHKQEISFVAYLKLEFEGNALYLSASDAQHGITANAISLDYPVACERSGGNMKYVFVRGEFIADNGPRNLFAGTLHRPSLCQLWPSSP